MIKKKIDKFEIKENVINYSLGSLELEKERERIIINNCRTIITNNSIFLVPVITVMIELLKHNPNIKSLIITFGLILIGLIIIAIILATISQMLLRTVYTRTGIEYINFLNSIDDKNNEELYLDQRIKDIDDIINSKKKNNDKRRLLLDISYSFNYTFYFLLAIFTLVILIKI